MQAPLIGNGIHIDRLRLPIDRLAQPHPTEIDFQYFKYTLIVIRDRLALAKDAAVALKSQMIAQCEVSWIHQTAGRAEHIDRQPIRLLMSESRQDTFTRGHTS